MALPQTFTGGAPWWRQTSYRGPFKAPNGAIYCQTDNSSGKPSIFKSTNPESTAFTEVDGAGRPTVDATRSSWAVLDGAIIHIVQHGIGLIQYHSFDTSSDTWTTIEEEVENPKNNPHDNNAFASIGVRSSDGDKIVLYNGDTDANMGTEYQRVDYALEEGGGWTTGIEVSANSPVTTDYTGGVIVRGESDKMHFFWKDNTNLDAKHRSLDSSNNFTATEDIDTNVAGTGTTGIFTPGVYYDDDGVERITICYRDSTDDLSSVIVEDDASPDTPETAVSDVDVQIDLLSVGGCLAVYEKTVHLLYSVIETDGSNPLDLNYDSNVDDGGWGTDVEELEGTVEKVSCNAFVRGGNIVLAYVYVDLTTPKYNERFLASAGAAGTLAPTHRKYVLHNLLR